jgi:hypothetical protein
MSGGSILAVIAAPVGAIVGSFSIVKKYWRVLREPADISFNEAMLKLLFNALIGAVIFGVAGYLIGSYLQYAKRTR